MLGKSTREVKGYVTCNFNRCCEVRIKGMERLERDWKWGYIGLEEG